MTNRTDLPINTKKPTSSDEYTTQFSKDIQAVFQQLRAVIIEAAPEALERISYGMPGFYQQGMLAWFALHTRILQVLHAGLKRAAYKEIGTI